MKDSKLTILFRAIRNYGIAEVARIFLSSLVNMGGKRLILFAFTHPKPIHKASKASRKHTFKFATEEELRNLSNSLQHDPDNCPSESDIRNVAKGYARCMIHLDGNILVGYSWVWNSRLAYIIDGFHLNLPDGTLYNYKGYTSVDYRGYGFQALRPQQLLKLLKREGITHLLCYVDRTNPRSLRGIKKSGYEKVGELKIRHIHNGMINVNLTLEGKYWVENAGT